MTAWRMLREAWQALDGPPDAIDRIRWSAVSTVRSAFPVANLAAASIAAAVLALDTYRRAGASAPADAPITIDRDLAGQWFSTSYIPIGWDRPPIWDAIAGVYRCRDGWIRLHTNAPHHRDAALRVLGCAADRAAVAGVVKGCTGDDLEQAIIDAGGCAARMRTIDDWAVHPQGRAVRTESLIDRRHITGSGTRQPAFSAATSPSARTRGVERNRDLDPARPLAGIRVLDLTRVLAGPIATRFLAGYGASVVRIDPPDWDEPPVLPDTTLGKACARLDLRTVDGRARFEDLLAGADLLVHGYRPGALDGLGFDEARRAAINPALIEVCLDAWGWTGPWRQRRGFDSLVQMASGIADAGMRWKGANDPVPLPWQALDHATGYLMAAAAIRALQARRDESHITRARASLARTGWWLVEHRDDQAPGATPSTSTPAPAPAQSTAGEQPEDGTVESSGWGPLRRLPPPVRITDCPMRWDRPAMPLGSASAEWPGPSR